MLLNSVVGEDSRVPWTARRSNQSILKEISPEYTLKDSCWSWNSNTLATWYKEMTYLKRPWCWERLRAGGEWDNRGWDGWMASPNQWAWVWVNSGSSWWTGRPGFLRFTGSQKLRHDWATELNWKRSTCSIYHSGLEKYIYILSIARHLTWVRNWDFLGLSILIIKADSLYDFFKTS